MISKRIGGLCAGLALGLGACADDYGYGGVQLGYGNAGYYGDPYYDGYGYGGLGYGSALAPSNFGWYGDYYYPGAGIYVYDSYRRPYRWNGAQQRYWSAQQRYRGRDWNGQGSWDRFNRGSGQWRGNRNGYAQGQGYRGGTPGQFGQRRDGGMVRDRGSYGQPGFGANRGSRPDGIGGYRGSRDAVTPRAEGAGGRWGGRGGGGDPDRGFRNGAGGGRVARD